MKVGIEQELDAGGLLTEVTHQTQHGNTHRRPLELLLVSSCLNTNICYLTGEAWKEKKGKNKKRSFFKADLAPSARSTDTLGP